MQWKCDFVVYCTKITTQHSHDFVVRRILQHNVISLWLLENQKKKNRITIPLFKLHNEIVILLCWETQKEIPWIGRALWGKEGIDGEKGKEKGRDEERKKKRKEERVVGRVGANNWRKKKGYFSLFHVLLGANSKFGRVNINSPWNIAECVLG